MFLHHFVNGHRREDFPHWYYPLIGLVNMCQTIHDAGTSRNGQDSAALRQLRASYWKILDAIWNDLHLLNPASHDMANIWMSEVSSFIGTFKHVFGQKLYVFELLFQAYSDDFPQKIIREENHITCEALLV